MLDVVAQYNQTSTRMHCCLILSIDRRHTLPQAEEIVNLALANKTRGVVGVDLCGNPSRGDVSVLRPAFVRAKASGLRLTLHFGEVAASGTADELRALLELQPDRLGHVIHVPGDIKQEIRRRRLGLELCLSCNVLASLTMGGYADHHFGEWRHSECRIALAVSYCVDDLIHSTIVSLTPGRLTTSVSFRVRCLMSTAWRWSTSLSRAANSSPSAAALWTACLVPLRRRTV